MPINSVIAPILNTVLDAVVVMDRAGVVRAWNGHAEMIFGWSADEAIGRDLDALIIPPALGKRTGAGLPGTTRRRWAGYHRQASRAHRLAQERHRVPNRAFDHARDRRRRRRVRRFLRDIFDQKETERRFERQLRESRLMLELSELASRNADFDEALQPILNSICELAEWPVGRAFLIGDDERSLSSSVWNSGAKEAAPGLVEATEATTSRIGIGLPGKVLQTGEAVWVSRLKKSGFPRRGLGFEAAFAFPIISGGRCIAVMEFFSYSRRDADEAMLLSVRAIGAQVGRAARADAVRRAAHHVGQRAQPPRQEHARGRPRNGPLELRLGDRCDRSTANVR